MEDVEYLLNLLNNSESPIAYDPEDYDNRVIALSEHLFIKGNTKEMDKITKKWDFQYGDIFLYEDRTYFVATDYDADMVFEEMLSNDLDHFIYDKISCEFHQYIDAQSFVSDKMRESNRGEYLAIVDSIEYKTVVDKESYYIYRLS